MTETDNFFRADLHCHSNRSDGTLSPSEIVRLACERGLQGLSITDHDTIEAYPEALAEARNKGLRLLSGVELSAVHRNTSVHILAYAFSTHSAIIKEFCRNHFRRRKNRLLLILEKLASAGIPLTEEEVEPKGSEEFRSVGRPHIALAMIERGYVASVKEAFLRYLGEGKPCYVPGEAYSVEETLDVIGAAKAFAVIAHPHLIKDKDVLKDLLAMKFDGIEGYYARFSPHEHARWVKIGRKKGWFITGGSDFHGTIKPETALGSSWAGEEIFSFLMERFEENQANSHA